MFKIKIQSGDGRELKLSKGKYVYHKDSNGKESFWEWEHLAGKEEKFDRIFDQAERLIRQTEETLPDLPMTGYR